MGLSHHLLDFLRSTPPLAFGRASQRLSIPAWTNRSCLRIDIRRLRKTTRSEHSDLTDAQTSSGRSVSHRTADIHRFALYSRDAPTLFQSHLGTAICSEAQDTLKPSAICALSVTITRQCSRRSAWAWRRWPGRSIRKYLRRNLPSRPCRGPPQLRHSIWRSVVGPAGASTRTNL